MTIVGKILVFINLVFSLLLGFLVLVVHANRVRSDKIVESQKARLDVVEAENKALRNENGSFLDKEYEFQNQIGEFVGVKQGDTPQDTKANVAAKLKTLDYQTKSRDELLKQTQDDLVAERNKNTEREAAIKAVILEAERRQKDVEEMRVALAAEIDKSTKLLAEKTKAVQERTKAELDAKSAIETAQRLERQVQELSTELVRIQDNAARPGGTVGGIPAGSFVRSTPPVDVEGLVLSTDDRYDLYKLSIGSDSGLQKGHTLELFRLSKVPGQSRYLGTVRITDVGPKEAVAMPVGKLADRPRPGDQVASRINKSQ
jgi:hypothetical protein